MCRRRRDREGPSDEPLLEGLDRLVETESIVETGERLGVNDRTPAKCHEFRYVSRRMLEALRKYVRQQGELGEQGVQGGEEVSSASEDEPAGGEEARLQQPQPDLLHEVELLRAEVVSLRERVEAAEGQAARARGGGDVNVDVEDVGADGESKRKRSVAAPSRVFPELIAEEAEPGEERFYGAAAELVVE